MNIKILIVSLFLTGCTTIAPIGNGQFTVHSASAPRAAMFAARKCAEFDKTLEVKNVISDGINGDTLVFICK